MARSKHVTTLQKLSAIQLYTRGSNCSSIARKLGLSLVTISKIVNSWKRAELITKKEIRKGSYKLTAQQIYNILPAVCIMGQTSAFRKMKGLLLQWPQPKTDNFAKNFPFYVDLQISFTQSNSAPMSGITLMWLIQTLHDIDLNDLLH